MVGCKYMDILVLIFDCSRFHRLNLHIFRMLARNYLAGNSSIHMSCRAILLNVSTYR